jgi:hypothetical protein
VRNVSQLHLNQLFSNNKISIKIIKYSPISGFYHYSFAPAMVLLGIFYIINAYTLDGQHKEPQQQQQWGQQQREQPECQSATSPSAYS